MQGLTPRPAAGQPRLARTLSAVRFLSKKRLIRLLKVGAGILIALGIVGALRGNWAQVRDLADELDWRWLGAAGLAAMMYRVLNAAGWGMVLRALGHPLPVWTGVRLWLVAETMRWLPGSVWGFASRVYQAREHGVPAAAASLSMPLELAITVIAWTLAALAGGTGLESIVKDWMAHLPAVPWVAVTAVLILLAALGVMLFRRFPHSKISSKARGFLAGLGSAFAARPRPGLLLATLAWFTGLCFLNGLAFYAILRGFGPLVMPAASVVIGINAIGWLIGFFAVFTPGGLGVREGGMTALLAPLLPLPIAVGSVVLWRVVQIFVEVLCLGVCYALAAASAPRRAQAAAAREVA